jgi:hypothetical protein
MGCNFFFVGARIKIRVFVKGARIKLVVFELGQWENFFYKPSVKRIIVRFGFFLAKGGG